MFKKKVRNKTFDYIPRFYNEQKEDLEQRVSQGKGLKNSGINQTKNNIRSGLRRKSRASKTVASQSRRQSTIRLFVIIMVLCFLTYLVLNSNIFIRFAEAMTG